MTPEHLEKLNRAKRERAAAAEKLIRRQVKKAWPLISQSDREKLTYIHGQLDRDDREEADRNLLRSVRKDIMRRYIPKEAATS